MDMVTAHTMEDIMEEVMVIGDMGATVATEAGIVAGATGAAVVVEAAVEAVEVEAVVGVVEVVVAEEVEEVAEVVVVDTDFGVREYFLKKMKN